MSAGFLGKSMSVTRFSVIIPGGEPDFERARFFAIEPGSEVRERIGLLPFDLDSEWKIGSDRYAFRLRVDKIRPDPTSVKERLRELIKTEMSETGKPFVGARTRKKLRELAEAEAVIGVPPKATITEAVIDGSTLYVASTSKGQLGMILSLLRQCGIEADFRAPWLDADAGPVESDIIVPTHPAESVLGCFFARKLIEEPDVLVEPEAGAAKLATREGRVTLAGAVLNDLYRYLEDGAEILSVKIHIPFEVDGAASAVLAKGNVQCRLEALSYRLGGVKLELPPAGTHWTEQIDQRLEQIGGVFAGLDAKYNKLKGEFHGKADAE
jgi:hypothetical protein